MESSATTRQGITANPSAKGQSHAIGHHSELEELRWENKSLRDRLTDLTEASYRIAQGLDIDTLLEEVVQGASSLLGAKYAVLLTYDESGGSTGQ